MEETAMEERQQYIKEKEVAKITGFSLQTLRNDRHRGQGIPYTKERKRAVRYLLADVLEYMEQGRIQTEAK
jgi:predicted DNA-binding transcriptional regulator AlpA